MISISFIIYIHVNIIAAVYSVICTNNVKKGGLAHNYVKQGKQYAIRTEVQSKNAIKLSLNLFGLNPPAR